MKIDIVTLFPSMVEGPLSGSIVGRARREGILKLGFANPRDFADDSRGTVDDRPYGGGPGMLMMAEPIRRALKSVKKKGSLTVLLSPCGRKLDQRLARELAGMKHLILICGHYEGVDARIVPEFDMELSIGDYILTGGEPAAVVVTDCVTRLLPGVLKKEGAASEETFKDWLLEAPQYTRPSVWRRKKVPGILTGGNHAEIARWRREQSLALTKKRRPDLMKRHKAVE
ncbi:MAG: tRNA (guanosine(37)-N1)-methyltransferase TrmD [bacterium]